MRITDKSKGDEEEEKVKKWGEEERTRETRRMVKSERDEDGGKEGMKEEW